MKVLFDTIKYFVFLVIVTQILPKMFNPDVNYNIMQIMFLLVLAFGISKRKHKKNEEGVHHE